MADLAIGLLIAACRNLCAGDRFVRDGQWELHPQPSAIPLARRFSGMRVGIVGMGRVGRAVAVRAAAFGCPISYTDLRPMDDVAHRFVPNLMDLARDSDALVLCAAADKAEGIVDAAVLEALGPRGFLVNVARGRLVNEADLTQALAAGRIAGAGLDVFVDEPRVPAGAAPVRPRDPAGPPRQRHLGDPHRDGRDGAREPRAGAGGRTPGDEPDHLRRGFRRIAPAQETRWRQVHAHPTHRAHPGLHPRSGRPRA